MVETNLVVSFEKSLGADITELAGNTIEFGEE